jgi:predicted enzyme related to lactoylglutathione lyase
MEVPPEIQEAVDRDVAAGKLEADAWAMLVPPGGADGPRLLFQRRPKTQPESIPIHLDLKADDPEAEIERLTGLGATVVETKSHSIGEFEETWTVLRDPEGNGFCVS